MSILTRKEHRKYVNDVDDLAYGPSGGTAKRWLAGVFLAAVPVIYGIICIQDGHTTLFVRYGEFDLTGDAGLSLAVAYFAAGAFLHFHYYWGLGPRLWQYSQALKVIALVVFIPSFIYALFHIFL